MSDIIQKLQNSADRIRINSIKATNASKSGHPTSCASMAEIISVLFLDVMKYFVHDPRNPNNDRFVLSKGHAAPGLYAAWIEAGLLKLEDVMNLRKITSDLEGHPTPRLNFIDVATGSLGQGLNCAVGMAYTGKYFDKSDYRVYCVIGDGESAEGSIWEAMSFGSHYKLDNMVAIFDINRLGQSEPTAYQHNIDVYEARTKAFGWNTIVVDGNDIKQLRDAFASAEKVKGQPSAIIAKTFKGAGLPGISDMENWHGKPLGAKGDELIAYLEEKINKNSIGGAGDQPNLAPKQPELKLKVIEPQTVKLSSSPSYEKGHMIATREAYGNALVKLGESCPQVVALDADVKNSTFSIKFQKKFPERFVECFIAEQNMVGVAIGCGTRNRTIPFVSTFGAFFSRAFDHLRMGAISQTCCTFAGSHAGVSIGEDGPSQMALEDLSMFGSIPNCVVFYPTDGVATERAVELSANYRCGMSFIRTGRPAAKVIYSCDEVFEIGRGKIVHHGTDNPDVTIVGAGVTLHAALEVAEKLNGKINVRVVDPFTIRPIDVDLMIRCCRETKSGRIIVVEDHYRTGGICESITTALATREHGLSFQMTSLAVDSVPRSGKPEELLARYKLDAAGIEMTVREITK